ncbi:hypothetical protein [Kribbella sp. NPDC049227]|uniref:hypothetical protein n=1 Tax=Kribbella sp. NPDC049227 TaxID=3364113 RepID=UPI003722793D
MDETLPRLDDTIAWLPSAITATKNRILTIVERIGIRLNAVGLDIEALVRKVKDNDYTMWACGAHGDAYPHGIENPHGQALLGTVRLRMDRWRPALQQLLEGSGTVRQSDFSAAARVKPWATINITHLGDAVHYTPPVGGIGGNMALEVAQRQCRALIGDARESSLVPARKDFEVELVNRGLGTIRGFASTHGCPSRAIVRSALPAEKLAGSVVTWGSFGGLCAATSPRASAGKTDSSARRP